MIQSDMTNMHNNDFGKLLQELLSCTGTKSSTMAKTLQYDVSYISKWLSGKMLPSEKNAEQIMDAIAECLADAVKDGDLPKMLRTHGCVDAKGCKGVLREMLVEAYNSAKGADRRKTPGVSPSISALDLARLACGENGDERVAIIDLLSLDHDARLLLAGIVNGHFENTASNYKKRYAMGIVPRSVNEGECVYDSIFLVHMLTSYSGIDFNLYALPAAVDKFIYISRGSYGLTAMLFPGSECISAHEYKDVSEVNSLYDKMSSMLKQEQLIFKKSDMCEMIGDQTYVRSLLSSDLRWLLGHVTEHILPDDLFDELLSCFEKDSRDELKKLHILSDSALVQANTKVMIYDSALAMTASTGELDFFNRKVTLTVRQRIRFFKYLESLLDEGKIQLKIVYGGFSPDFQRITNPCMFMSDSVCYLRLENERYEDNLLVLQNMQVKELFDRFYSAIWDDRKDVVVDEKGKVKESVKRYKASVELLEKLG